MDWIFFVLMIAFIIWTAQILFVYKNQIEKIKGQIEVARISKMEVTEQAEHYEARAEQLASEQSELEKHVSSWESKESSIKKLVAKKKLQEANRRPTRFKVEKSESDAT